MGDVVKRIALSGHAETVEVKMGCLELAARCFDKAFQLEPSLRRTFKACEDAVITLIELAKKYERPR